jgi:hypothetical protein
MDASQAVLPQVMSAPDFCGLQEIYGYLLEMLLVRRIGKIVPKGRTLALNELRRVPLSLSS